MVILAQNLFGIVDEQGGSTGCSLMHPRTRAPTAVAALKSTYVILGAR